MAYFVLIGGTSVGEVEPAIRLVNASIGAVFLITYVTQAPARADKTDRWVLLAVVLFASAAVFSAFPRQSFDAALSGLGYAAGLFAARELLREARARNLVIVTLLVLSFVVTLVAAARWLPMVVEWWELNAWVAIPPLDLALPSTPWGHRHDVALLVAMLYPSWWIGHPSRFRQIAGAAVGILAGLIILVDGSRTLWFALAMSTSVLLSGSLIRRLRSRRAAVLAIATVCGLGLIATAAGATDAVTDRLFNMDTLSARSAMWRPLGEAWSERPIAGWGPGSFPWILQLTNYFDTQTWTPRHPDSVIFQLLPEAGLLGVAAAMAVILGVAPGILRTEFRPAVWALVVFAGAGIGASPTDFPFLMAVAITWTALAVPHSVEASTRGPLVSKTRHLRPSPSVVALGIVGIAVLATGIGGLFYGAARSAANSSESDVAEEHLSTAIVLDPGMAMYWRQRGISRLGEGDPTGAVDDLEEATARNPSDDVAWRSLAVAYRAAGKPDSATAALNRALNARRADPTNLLLMASWQIADSNDTAAMETLAEVVQAWPAITGAPGWQLMLAEASFDSLDVIAAAADRWEAGSTAPAGDPNLLSVLSGREGMRDSTGAPLGKAVRLTYRCGFRETGSASALERRNYLYWERRIRASAWEGHRDTAAERVFELMTGWSPRDGASDRLSPFVNHDAVGFSSDVWGYRRAPIRWTIDTIQLPSPRAGATRWRTQPAEAAQEAAGGEPASCGET